MPIPVQFIPFFLLIPMASLLMPRYSASAAKAAEYVMTVDLWISQV
jgi:hypothetical protein